jgi:catechol 2,3-dioxygenase-like lactoylglutathione lyase family enzyme
MALLKLDHVTVLCSDLDRSRRFYAQVLEMPDGERPDFDFPGAWLYVGDRAAVHLVGDRNDVGVMPTGGFDHMAFDADDLPGTRARLNRLGVEFEEAAVPGGRLHQVFILDPDGVKIELNFRN